MKLDEKAYLQEGSQPAQLNLYRYCARCADQRACDLSQRAAVGIFAFGSREREVTGVQDTLELSLTK